MSKFAIIAATSSVFILAACVGTDVGNPASDGSATVEFVVPEQHTTAQALSAQGWTIKRFEVGVQGVEVMPACEDDPVALPFEPTVLDFLGNKRSVDVDAEEEVVCKLTFNFGDGEASWLFVDLQHTDGRDVSIRGTNPDRIRYAGTVPLRGTRLYSRHAVLPWFVEESDALDALPDGATIDENEHPRVFRSFLRALLPNARLLLDEDRGGSLDAGDRAVAAPEI